MLLFSSFSGDWLGEYLMGRAEIVRIDACLPVPPSSNPKSHKSLSNLYREEGGSNNSKIYRATHDGSLDTFKLTYLLPPVAVLALIFNYAYTPFELTWSFSIWLESVAILPQLFMLQRTGEAETITTHYLAALGLYRGLYIPNWIYR